MYLTWAFVCFGIGIILFSGSLYLLALTQKKIFGPITPLGGLFFILGWVFFDEAPFDKLIPGVFLIVAGGMLIVWREHYLRRRSSSSDDE